MMNDLIYILMLSCFLLYLVALIILTDKDAKAIFLKDVKNLTNKFKFKKKTL